jgi:hypothetical protein
MSVLHLPRPDGMDRNEYSFALMDRMPKALRQCVYEFSFPVVMAFVNAGITNPGTISNLIREVWAGARSSRQGNDKAASLDWMLLQAGAEIGAAELCRLLANESMMIVPKAPTREMIMASMSEVSGFNVKCTKYDKHRLRLTAALVAGSEYFQQLRDYRANLVSRPSAGNRKKDPAA